MNKKAEEMVGKELIFVYNAYSNLFNRWMDMAHKVLSPATYSCSLCQVTYGYFTMHQEWANFISQLSYRVSFQYKDQWKDAGRPGRFPLVALKDGEEVRILLLPEELENLHSLQDLIHVLKSKLNEVHQNG